MSRKITLLLGIFVAIIILIPFMIPSNYKVPQPSPVPNENIVPETSLKEIEITAENYEYSLKEIVLKKGDKVKLTISSNEGRHNFSVNELALASPVVEENESATIEFTADLEAGEYEYYCAIGDHRQRGMTGILRIE